MQCNLHNSKLQVRITSLAVIDQEYITWSPDQTNWDFSVRFRRLPCCLECTRAGFRSTELKREFELSEILGISRNLSFSFGQIFTLYFWSTMLALAYHARESHLWFLAAAGYFSVRKQLKTLTRITRKAQHVGQYKCPCYHTTQWLLVYGESRICVELA